VTPSAVTAGGLVLDIAGALILASGLVLKTVEEALDEASPRYDFNASLDASLASQTADAQVGAAVLVAGFLVQGAAALGWHEASWWATIAAVVAAGAAAAGAWMFLTRRWRPMRIRDALFHRLRMSQLGVWWPALAAFGALLAVQSKRDDETVEAFAVRIIGQRRWDVLTANVDPNVLRVYTIPRSELRGTNEYWAAHPEEVDPSAPTI